MKEKKLEKKREWESVKAMLSTFFHFKRNATSQRIAFNPDKNESAQVSTLFVDIANYSALQPDKQKSAIDCLNSIILAALDGINDICNVIKIPIGDGDILVFANADPMTAFQVGKSIFDKLHLKNVEFKLRMGIDVGRVKFYQDINDRMNVAGTVINNVQRIASNAEPGNILLTEGARHDLDTSLYNKFTFIGVFVDKQGEKRNVYMYTDEGVQDTTINPQFFYDLAYLKNKGLIYLYEDIEKVEPNLIDRIKNAKEKIWFLNPLLGDVVSISAAVLESINNGVSDVRILLWRPDTEIHKSLKTDMKLSSMNTQIQLLEDALCAKWPWRILMVPCKYNEIPYCNLYRIDNKVIYTPLLKKLSLSSKLPTIEFDIFEQKKSVFSSIYLEYFELLWECSVKKFYLKEELAVIKAENTSIVNTGDGEISPRFAIKSDGKNERNFLINTTVPYNMRCTIVCLIKKYIEPHTMLGNPSLTIGKSQIQIIIEGKSDEVKSYIIDIYTDAYCALRHSGNFQGFSSLKIAFNKTDYPVLCGGLIIYKSF